MATKIPQDLTIIENRIRQETSIKHHEEIQLMADGLNIYLSGFNLIDSFIYSDKNEVETTWLLLLVRSFHSLRCAIQLTIMGYYGQAVSLLRTVTENVFICNDCVNNPKVTEAILHKKYRIPDSHEGLSFRQMALRTNNMKVYNNDYNHQSEVSHPSYLSVRIIVDQEKMMINSSPIYNEVLFLDCCEQFFRNTLMMNEFMGQFLSKLSETKVKSWGETANQTCKNVADWLNALKEKYHEMSEPI